MRNKYKEILKEYNLEPKIIVIKTPKSIVIERIEKRIGSNADEIMLTTEETKNIMIILNFQQRMKENSLLLMDSEKKASNN